MFTIQDETSFFETFPNLVERGPIKNFTRRSRETDDYNCIAYAAGDKTRWWWPQRGEIAPNGNEAYWPKGCPLGFSVGDFIQTFSIALGYAECDNHETERGYQKLAIWERHNRKVSHMAILIPHRDGWAMSKIGESVDIEHRLDALDSDTYGSVAAFLKRPKRW